MADFNEELKYFPDSHHSYNNRWLAEIELGMYDEALQDFNIAIDFEPLNSNFYSNRGRVYLDMKNYQKCLVEYLIAYHLLSPNTPDQPWLSKNGEGYKYLHNIAFCYLQLKNYKISKVYCELSLKEIENVKASQANAQPTILLLNYLNKKLNEV